MTFYYLFFIFLFLAGVIGVIYMSWEARTPKISFHKVSVSGSGKKSGNNRIRAIHLSDIHIHMMPIKHTVIRKIIDELAPDIILLTGDYIEFPDDLPIFKNFLSEIIPPGIPCYACPGNHDVSAYRTESRVVFDDPDHTKSTDNDFYKINTVDFAGYYEFLNSFNDTGMMMLDNANTIYEKAGKKLQIIGVSDIRFEQHDFEKAYSGFDPSLPTVVLVHNPDAIYLAEGFKSDCILSGHFHGGQIWLPFDIEYKVLRQDKLCRNGYSKGYHIINNKRIFINRGLGCVLYPFRLGSPPEIACLDFYV